jgi:AcrR family transcriptional regulator
LQTQETAPRVDQDNGEKASRFDHRREKILNAASALFNRHGLRDATLAVIAAEIGLNFKSLRHYFKRREDLVSAVFMRSIDLHQRIAHDALAETGIEARVRRFVRSYFELLAAVQRKEHPEFAYFGDLRALTEPHSDLVWPAYGRMFKTIRTLFQAPDFIPDNSRLNAATHMLLSQLLWTPVWATDYFLQDLPMVTEAFADILLYGIASLPIDLSRFADSHLVQVEEGDRLSQASFLRKAISLINQYGYRGASVDRISSELNVTKGAFYHHNETLDELVVACFEHSFACVRDAQDTALANESSGILRVTSSAVALVRQQMLDSGTLLRTAALTSVGPELRQRMAMQMSRLTLRFSNMLNDGLIDGSVRPCNLHIAAEMTTAMINSSEELGRWVKSASLENAADLCVRPLLSGLVAYGRNP